MCGIAGALYSQPKLNQEEFLSLMRTMGDTLTHRGPDDHGEWVDVDAGVGFAHRRLSIIDLSHAGHQPMTSRNNRYVIIFNGEIYNYQEIRSKLDKSGVVFRGHSDTETLLESIAYQGLDQTLNLINGMFAFALWDKETRLLTLVRDRIGKKPLYYGWSNGVFLFGSELKALKKHPAFNDEIDRAALGQFIQYSWLNGPASIYTQIKKLIPGSYLTISSDSNELVAITYWSALEQAKLGQSNTFSDSYDTAIEQLNNVLLDAVKRRMIADVELGALLSGGIDSSLVVSMMQAQSSRTIKTFSIGFHEETHNEAIYAKKVSEYLQTEHIECYVSPQDCIDVIQKLPEIYDEPFADVSQIPTYLVSKLANQQVKVVLSGDGGDELFAGYTRYFRCMKHWEKQKKIPKYFRPVLSVLMSGVANVSWHMLANKKSQGDIAEWLRFGAKLEKRARRIHSNNSLELFVSMMKRYKDIDSLVIKGVGSHNLLSDSRSWPYHEDSILNMMLIDTLCYLPDDILVKVDRASMATSLEARAPLLDREVAEFAWQLPYEMKVNNAGGKRILKDILAKYVPSELTDRKKMGFGVPIGKWLRGSLRDWAEDLLDENKIKQQGYLNEIAVQKIWKQHISGWRNHNDLLWSILMFQAWLENDR